MHGTISAEATTSEREWDGNLTIIESDTLRTCAMVRANDHSEAARWIVRLIDDPDEFGRGIIIEEDSAGKLDEYSIIRETIDMEFRTSHKAVYLAASNAAAESNVPISEILLGWMEGTPGDEYINELQYKCRKILKTSFIHDDVTDDEVLEEIEEITR